MSLHRYPAPICKLLQLGDNAALAVVVRQVQGVALQGGVAQRFQRRFAAVHRQHFAEAGLAGPVRGAVFHGGWAACVQATDSRPVASRVTRSADCCMRAAISSICAPLMGLWMEPATKHMTGISLSTNTGTEMVLTS